ncbi:hypothetical protein A2634_04335 [Candidatus Amesbacteria bacterium RIFCSPHIGHO2_01_FULL_48_32]|uniref:Uncharacterized protein n=1 Tax=Candidatus Amesbacteria bacterium RIFCSPLOWO2_01_FULL_48_25 TaxID=1797259 RepID=A0A1F4ZBM3_9BACT|nr:MAG: hypothetical protein A2634_04335 [Candidatus Amesbacteria bacterium RIFCSPHIGHO2_01_FULL_48_32]OGD03779.1 MAG: hypothetical protein A2989_03800 [Candidatus Amesbacteria bacterium RIFCSPLOWO2_01_FULL_48_25]HJZ05115.1 hypothetical protein [Patescibacteria group bacterium]
MSRLERNKGMGASGEEVDLFKLYSGQGDKLDVLYRALDGLRKVRQDPNDRGVLNDVLAQREGEFLVKASPQLGGRSPLMLLHEKLDEEQSRANFGQAASIKSSRRGQEDFGPNFGAVFSKKEIMSLPAGVETVHLSAQELINKAVIDRLLRAHPNLKVLQIPESHMRMVGPGIRAILEKRGIELRIGRVRDIPFYDDGGGGKMEHEDGYREKKEVYAALLEGGRKGEIFALMEKHELNEALVAKEYLSGSWKSLSDVASELGLPLSRVQRCISALMCWAGRPIQDKIAQRRAANLEKLVLRLEKAEAQGKERDRLRSECSVGDELPPRELRVARWKDWQRVVTLYRANPDSLERLKERHSGRYRALINYLHIEELGGQNRNFGRIG